MAYSVSCVLKDYANKHGLHQILIRVIYNRQKVYASTEYKVTKDQFEDGQVVKHPHKARINAALLNKRNDLTGELLKLIEKGSIEKHHLKALISGKTDRLRFTDFVDEYLETYGGKKSTGKMYSSVRNVVEKYDPDVMLDQMTVEWFRKFETHERKLNKGPNTVHKNCKKTKTLLYAAAEAGLVDDKIFEKYSPPTYNQTPPEWLTEDEIAKFKQECDTIANETKKLCGYYFLLSCYAGFRLKDATDFNYKARVNDGKIVLHTTKKGKIVAMPIHDRLREVLDFIKDKQLSISETHLREYVYDIAKIAGVDRRIKFHTSRHTFGMLLMENDFSLEETAELMGIDLETAKTYARITNKRLERRVLDKLNK